MTIKEAVKALYEKAAAESWGGQWLIFPNELDVLKDYSGAVNSSTLIYGDRCTMMPSTQKAFVEGLGFGFEYIEHEKRYNGATYLDHCHILYNGRELTADELWLTDLKQRAINIGFDVRDDTNTGIGWGFYGATISDAVDAFIAFYNKTSVSGSGSVYAHGSGYIECYTSIYAYSMVSITEPIPPPPCYEDYGCTILREFDTWDGTKDIHVTEVQCRCLNDPSKTFTTQVIDYDWSWICDAADIACITPCECTPWQDADCISETERRQVRTCTPAGCDIEEQMVDDPSCATAVPSKPFPIVPLIIIAGGGLAAAYFILKKTKNYLSRKNK